MDQTSFNQSQEILQAPPESPAQSVTTTPTISKASPKKTILVVLLFITAILLTLLMLAVKTRPVQNTFFQNLIPSPSPTIRISEFGAQLQQLDLRISDADPSKINLSPPTILNFNLEL